MLKVPKLIPSPSFTTTSTPIRSSLGVLDALRPSGSTSDSSSYILSVTSLGSQYAISTSAPENAIHVVDGETLKFVCSLDGEGARGYGPAKGKGHGKAVSAHEGGVTCAKSIGNGSGGIISCGKEGTVIIWDTRTAAAAVKMQTSSGVQGKPLSLLSCDISSDGWTVAAGAELQGEDAVISYWDPRKPSAHLLTHSSAHSDDITVVSFAPSGFSVDEVPISGEDTDMGSASQESTASDTKLLLLTGATDGLLNISDAYEQDEDEAVLLTANLGCSIAQAGWVGSEGVWVGSDMETFSTWTSNFDPVWDFEVREPGAHAEKVQWVTDYLVGCHSSASLTASGSPQLRVFVGSNEGDVALITTKNPFQKYSQLSSRKRQTPSKLAPWYLQNSWTHQHVGVVRALLYDEQHNVVVTGGEDAKLHVWRDPNSGIDGLYEGEDDVEMEIDEDVDRTPRPREANPKKRELRSDDEDDVMDGKRRRR